VPDETAISPPLSQTGEGERRAHNAAIIAARISSSSTAV
jgi:hypothetical protein